MNSDRHTLVWWERFWKSAQYNFGSPRAELIQEFKTYRDRNKDKELKAIDIGSGNGRYALELAKIGYETFALELTKSGCELINKAAHAKRLNIGVIQGDVLDNKIDTTYDLVVSSGLVEEIPLQQHPGLIANIKAYCKEGGLLVLKYCLEISERGRTVSENSIPPLFAGDNDWEIIDVKTDPVMRNSIANIDFENMIRTETIIAKRLKGSKQ